MVEYFPYLLLLLLVIVGLTMVANRLKVAYPILLVIGGLALSFIPKLPNITIDPNWVLLIFLPPLLYADAWALSPKELWKWRRIIFSFAFIVVFITAAAVAWVANMILPGFSIALGFLFGGVIGSTDVVSVSAILKFVKVPHRMATILENESLLNDASSLIVFRFAALVVTTGQFVWYEMVGSFIWVVLGGIGIGLVVAWIIRNLHKILPTDANMDIVITLISPYIMYILANEAQTSGVLSVVAGGVYLAYNRNRIFTASTRNKSVAVWDNIIFILNGLAFSIIGLSLPQILSGIEEEGMSLTTATYYGLLMSAVIIGVRILSAYASVIITQIAKRFIKVADGRRYDNAGVPLILGWAGMRGVLSLAVALSIPLTLDDGSPFPYRNLILYMTFIVIFITLVVQGLTLPLLIKQVKFPEFDDHIPDNEAETLIRKELARVALEYMDDNYKEGVTNSFLLKNQQDVWRFHLETPLCNATPDVRSKYIAILRHQRQHLEDLNKNPRINEELIRSFERQLNLEEEKWENA
ncbi:MAG: Na+/H+ antiporter [Capnocytophaga sp.]|nr:Na+/H+ antiporter [Capnocytophaga sp.]